VFVRVFFICVPMRVICTASGQRQAARHTIPAAITGFFMPYRADILVCSGMICHYHMEHIGYDDTYWHGSGMGVTLVL